MEVWDNEYPDSSEYTHFYTPYIELVEKGNIISTLSTQMHELFTLINSVPAERAFYAYEMGKWTLKEVIGHMIETERVFSYRALAISRGEKQSLPGMDQNEYMVGNNYNKRTLSNLSNEFLAVRVATIHLLSNMTKDMINMSGEANSTKVTVRAIAHIIAGHEQHHVNIIKERYLN
ncbi:MAG TPA: DinB family protein [Balneolaceae bacterium]|nr:DinB family protein [Balneolaceae bacterium]|tara:strand:- start:79112 stop:79639 length:528 start_codon:yes stop_codon:yes gene_type:complete